MKLRVDVEVDSADDLNKPHERENVCMEAPSRRVFEREAGGGSVAAVGGPDRGALFPGESSHPELAMGRVLRTGTRLSFPQCSLVLPKSSFLHGSPRRSWRDAVLGSDQ